MNLRRIAHEGGSPEGTNSTYVLPDRGVVIDPGPPGERAWETLREGIDATGDVADIGHVLCTHWHIDHVGLAVRLAEAAGASVHCHAADAPLVGEYDRERNRRLARDERALERWGVPPEQAAAVVEGDDPSSLPPTYPVRAHDGGETIAETGVELIHTPGHTLGHAAYRIDADTDSDVDTGAALFVGDAVLGTYTPNVGGSDTRVERALATYRDTLDRLRACRAEAYPGHGGRLDHRARIEEIGEHHDRRSADVLAVLDDRTPATPWEVATALFGTMGGIHVKMGAGEAAAHLEDLVSEGRARQIGTEPLRYDR